MGTPGWKLPQSERHRLLTQFAPKYPKVIADHVTAGNDRTPGHTEGRVVGVADDGFGVQALVVEISGRTERPDASTYHITWSLETGREAVESNDVIRECGWWPVREELIQLEPTKEVS